jgi:4,5-DOPA dioxygenase extradiol
LRGEGVMIVGSGNVVHNLRRLDRGAGETDHATAPWAQGFDGMVKQAMDAQDLPALAAWEFLSDGAATAVPFPDHYFPMLYAAGAAQAGEPPRHVFEGFHEGTLSMRCVQWG